MMAGIELLTCEKWEFTTVIDTLKWPLNKKMHLKWWFLAINHY